MGECKTNIIRVAVPSPLRRLFDYLVPQNSAQTDSVGRADIGCRVTVSFGRQELVGLIVAKANSSDIDIDKLKPINKLLDSTPLIPSSLFELFNWAANYYQHPIGDALFSTLPALLRRGEDLPELRTLYWQLTQKDSDLDDSSLNKAPKQKALFVRLKENKSIPDSVVATEFSKATVAALEKKGLIESILKNDKEFDLTNILKQDVLTLNKSQRLAFNNIDQHAFNCYLLDGVTGSGKTEIYLQAIEKTLRYGRQALVLIPEINLTPQTEARFRDRFNVPIAMLHSGLTDKQRLLAWTKARAGVAKIILGTRSAVFTPLCDPGLIIIDEEHDQSYKQQDGFRYSARDLAVIRARKENIAIILGSATPSIESMRNCELGRYIHLVLADRAGSAAQPNWSVIDLRTEQSDAGVSVSTLSAIRETISKGHQALIFINRRGFAPAIICHQCGWTAECRNCDSRLTVHQAKNRLICHHCEYQQRIPHLCPGCQGQQLVSVGEGTERSEEYLKTCFPKTDILRVDRDSTRKKGAMEAVYNIANSGEPCILVGTQMLAKGHHFKNVTLVAVLDADSGLFSPDFRSQERLGQLLTQVAGRSGRGHAPGQVYIQTHQPQHPLLETLTTRSYINFAKTVMAERELLQLPPFRFMAIIRAESERSREAEIFLKTARQIAESFVMPSNQLDYLGPLPAIMEKKLGRYRYILQITADKRSIIQSLLALVATALEQRRDSRKVRWSIDVDPQEL